MNEPYKSQKDKKLALKLGIQTYQILTNHDEVCVPSLSSIFLAVKAVYSQIGTDFCQTWQYLVNSKAFKAVTR